MDAIQPFAAIVLVVALLGGALLLLKKRGIAAFHLPAQLRANAARPKQMEMIERLTLGPHHAVHLVRLGDRRVLIATAPSHCQILESSLIQGFEQR